MVDDSLPSTVSTGRADSGDAVHGGHGLTDHALGRLAAALAPLAAMTSASGARSGYRDPRELVVHGAPPEETPLERACDRGVIRDARRVWRRWRLFAAEVRAVLLWVAERAGARVQAGAWALALGGALGPPADRAIVELERERMERAARAKAALQRTARGGLTREDAQELDRVTQREARARTALKAAEGRLRAWGEARLGVAVATWFGDALTPA